MAVQWSDDFKTGIRIIDEQHFGLVEKIGVLSLARRSGEEAAQAVSEQMLAPIRDYIVVHFTTEEKLMDSVAYPGSAAHKLEHAAFISQFEKIVAKARADAEMPTGDLENFLLRWVNGHILLEDVKMTAFLISQGIS